MPVLSEGVRGAAHRPQEGTQSLLCPLKGGIHIPIRRSPLGRGARHPCPLLDSVGHLSRVKVEPLSRSRIGANLDTSRRRCRDVFGSRNFIKALSKAMRGAERSADNMNMLHIVNTSVIAVFAVLVVFTGWQVYKIRQEVKNASEGIQSVYNAVYNTEGWSVFDGTIMNEEEWKKRNPEAYQRYLQEKEQREQGLK